MQLCMKNSRCNSTWKTQHDKLYMKTLDATPDEKLLMKTPDATVSTWKTPDGNSTCNYRWECPQELQMKTPRPPAQFKLSSALSRVLGIHTQTRAVIVAALWQYIKTNKLQDPDEREYVNNDTYLKEVFGIERMKFCEIPQRLQGKGNIDMEGLFSRNIVMEGLFSHHCLAPLRRPTIIPVRCESGEYWGVRFSKKECLMHPLFWP